MNTKSFSSFYKIFPFLDHGHWPSLLNFVLAAGLWIKPNPLYTGAIKPCDPKSPVCTPLSMNMYLCVIKMLNIALHRTRSNASNLSAASHHLCLGPHNALDTNNGSDDT